MKILLISAVSLLIGFGLGRVDGQELKAGNTFLVGYAEGPAIQEIEKGPLPDKLTAKAFENQLSKLRKAGYYVEMIQPSTVLVNVYLASTELEKRGLFGFGWKVQYGATAHYTMVEGAWVLGYTALKAWDQPPAVGGWEKIGVGSIQKLKIMGIFAEYEKVKIPKK